MESSLSPIRPRARSASSASPSSRLFRKKSSKSPKSPKILEGEEFSQWEELPEAIRFHITRFLDVKTIRNLSLVSHRLYAMACHDYVWRERYVKRFGAQSPKSVTGGSCYMKEYKRRLDSPEVGDKVQVLWDGSFNLVSGDTITGYEGKAWWEAVIVGKRDDNHFRIHYPQWDSGMWDEWVPRERIRWPPDPDTETTLKSGDKIELKCTSTFGRSPWLECRVRHVVGDFVDVGEVVVSGSSLVPRESVRLVECSPRTRRRLSFGRSRSGSEGRGRCVIQ